MSLSRFRWLAGGLAVALAVVAMGCSSKVEANDAAVSAAEYAFTIDQAFKAGTNEISFHNAGQEDHELGIVRIGEGHTLDDVSGALAGGAIPDWVTFPGGVWAIAPGVTQTGTVNLDAGSYILLCFVSGADGVPHFAKGMVTSFEVTGEAKTADAPKADIEVSAQDYAFNAPETVKSGEQTVHFQNTGNEPHFMGLIEIPSGMTFEQFAAAMASEEASPAGAPEPALIGGVNAVSPGHEAWVNVDFKPGLYAMVCFIPNAQGVPHAALGMLRPLSVE